jgi:cellulose 1,4-beta-cellobiosidase
MKRRLVLLVVLSFVVLVVRAQTQHFITLTWTAPSVAPASYNLYRSTTTGGPYTKLLNCLSTTIVDNTAVGGTKYFYVVRSVDSSGNESANSNEASATQLVNPGTPAGVTVTAGNAQATISWTAVTGATSYHVKRATVTGGPYTQVGAPTTTTFTDTALTNGTTYFYVVSAVSASGESANSTQVTVVPLVPVVPFPTGLTATPQ